MNEGKDSLNHQNSNDKDEVVQNKDKPKSTLKKPTKDIQNVHKMRKDCGLDLSKIKCKTKTKTYLKQTITK